MALSWLKGNRSVLSVRKQLLQKDYFAPLDDHLCPNVVRMNLLDEFPASAARRHDASVPPNGHDFLDLLFPSSHHRRDCAVLRAKSDAAGDVDADANKDLPASRN